MTPLIGVDTSMARSTTPKISWTSPHELDRGNVDSCQEAKTTAQVRICLGRTWWITCGGDTKETPFTHLVNHIITAIYPV